MNLRSLVSAALLLSSVMAWAPSFYANDERGKIIQNKSGEWMVEESRAREWESAHKLNEAAAVYRKVLHERQQLGLDLATERTALGKIYWAQGKNRQAEQQFKALLAERECASKGIDDITVAGVLCDYGDFLHAMGRKSESRQMKARAKSAEKRFQKED